MTNTQPAKPVRVGYGAQNAQQWHATAPHAPSQSKPLPYFDVKDDK